MKLVAIPGDDDLLNESLRELLARSQEKVSLIESLLLEYHQKVRHHLRGDEQFSHGLEEWVQAYETRLKRRAREAVSDFEKVLRYHDVTPGDMGLQWIENQDHLRDLANS